MKIGILLQILFVVLLSGTAISQNSPPAAEDKPNGNDDGTVQWLINLRRLAPRMESFDTNKDGKFDESEAKAYLIAHPRRLKKQEQHADGNSAVARFSNPYAIAIDKNGNLFVADTDNHAIRMISKVGDVKTFAGKPGEPGSNDGSLLDARFNKPGGISVGVDGVIYVSDSENRSIRKITVAGKVETVQLRPSGDSKEGQSSIKSIHGIAADKNGGILFADWDGNALFKVDQNGKLQRLPDSVHKFSGGVKDVARTDDGALYAVDHASVVMIKGADAKVILKHERTPEQDRMFMALDVDAKGNVYVLQSCEDIPDRILKVSPAGEVAVVAGGGGKGYLFENYINARGEFARFAKPRGIAVAPDGVIYVADTHNDAIRRITLDGTVTTLAGASPKK